MITETQNPAVWKELAAPLHPSDICWRQDGKVTTQGAKHIARFVAYIEANTVRERLDTVIPGGWDLTLELLPQQVGAGGEIDPDSAVAFKARLFVQSVIREDVGVGKDYKQAATDAFKRAAVRFGIGKELYGYDVNWVEMDGDGKFAKPVEDPQRAYERRHTSGAKSAAGTQPSPAPREGAAPEQTGGQTRAPAQPGETENEPTVACPKCGGRTYDNRLTKKNPKAPDYVCQNKARGCTGVVWPPKGKQATDAPRQIESAEDYPSALVAGADDLPF